MYRLVLDGMMGRTARWLRLLGCDVSYLGKATDEELIKVAKDEGRVLLTRDEVLYRKAVLRRVEAILLKGNDYILDLALLSKMLKLPLEVDPYKSRCPKCNELLRKAELNKVIKALPEPILKVYEDFWFCERCGKYYWQGSHYKSILKILNKAKQIKVKDLYS